MTFGIIVLACCVTLGTAIGVAAFGALEAWKERE